jgi:hypothetical protein
MMGGVLRVTANAMTWPTLAPTTNAMFILVGTGKATFVTAIKSRVPDAPNVTSAHRGPGTANHPTAVITMKVAIVNAATGWMSSVIRGEAVTPSPSQLVWREAARGRCTSRGQDTCTRSKVAEP